MDNIFKTLKEKNKPSLFVVYKYVSFTIVIALILLHVLKLTVIAFRYNKNYDFGKILQRTCGNEYFEAETPRFHLLEDIDKIRYKTYDAKKLLIVIIVMSVILTYLISSLLASMISNLFLNKRFIDVTIGGMQDYQRSVDMGIAGEFKQLLSPIYTIFQYIGSLKTLFLNQSNIETIEIFKLTMLLLVSLFAVFYIFVLYPLTVYFELMDPNSLNQESEIDASQKQYDFMLYLPRLVWHQIQTSVKGGVKYDNVNMWLFIVIMMRLIYFNVSARDTGVFSKYLYDNLQNLILSNNVAGFIGLLVILVAYKVAFDDLRTIMQIYKSIDQHDDVKTSRISDFLKTVWGKGDDAKKKSISQTVFRTMLFIILMIFALLIVLQYDTTELTNSRIILYGVMFPLLVYAIVNATIATIVEYDKRFDKFILSNPSTQYKQHIKTISNDFDRIIDSEYDRYMDSDKSVNICQNVGNGILSVLYSHLFEDIQNLYSDDRNKTGKIDIVPEFEYTETCDKNKIFDFTFSQKYKFSYYLKQKKRGKNIFYNSTICSTINQDVYEKMKQNIERIKNLPDNFVNIIHQSIHNVEHNKLYYNASSDILVKNDTITNNRLVNILSIPSHSGINSLYESIVNDVNDKYSEIYADLADLLQGKADQEQIVEKITFTISEKFDDINKMLSKTHVLDDKSRLMKYIIYNYNSTNKGKLDSGLQIFNKGAFDSIRSGKDVASEVMKSETFFKTSLRIAEQLNENVKIFENDKSNLKQHHENFQKKKEIFLLHIHEINTMKDKIAELLDIEFKDIFNYSRETFLGIMKEIQNVYETTKDAEVDANAVIKIRKDIAGLLSDVNYIQIRIDKFKNEHDPFMDSTMNRDQSLDALKDAKNVDKMIYAVVLNYIIVIVLSNFII